MISVLGSTGLLLLIFVVPWALARRTRHLHGFSDAEEQFFYAARALVKDGDTHQEIVEFVAILADDIRNPAAARWFFRAAFKGLLRDLNDNPPKDIGHFQEHVDALRPEMKKMFFRAVTNFVLATSYRSYFFGSVLRRVTFYSMKTAPQSAGVAVEGFTRRFNKVTDGNPA